VGFGICALCEQESYLYGYLCRSCREAMGVDRLGYSEWPEELRDLITEHQRWLNGYRYEFSVSELGEGAARDVDNLFYGEGEESYA